MIFKGGIKLKYTGPVFRPPFESNSLLLQVTVGCSHNSCSFCTMYANTSFEVESLSQIENDLLEARRTYRSVKRIFLVNGDPFVLSAEKLEKIAIKINEILPEVETITMYASIGNIVSKTDEELRRLRELKVNDLNIGLESGLQSTVEFMGKGFDIETAKNQLKRLESNGMNYSLNIIIGAAGQGKGILNARATSEFLNDLNPTLLFIATLHIGEESDLNSKVDFGDFKESSLKENLEEEIELLKGLELKNTHFFGLHVSNPVPVYGLLPLEKNKLLNELETGLDKMNEKTLNQTIKRSDSEGRIIWED